MKRNVKGCGERVVEEFARTGNDEIHVTHVVLVKWT